MCSRALLISPDVLPWDALAYARAACQQPPRGPPGALATRQGLILGESRKRLKRTYKEGTWLIRTALSQKVPSVAGGIFSMKSQLNIHENLHWTSGLKKLKKF